MQARSLSFGIFYFMGTVFAKIKLIFNTMGHHEPNKNRKTKADRASMQSDFVEKADECVENEDDRSSPSKILSSTDEVSMAKEKVSLLEGQICKQKMMMEEHQTKILLLEQLIKRQCLILKENDDNFTYEQLAKASPGSSRKDQPSLWDRIETQLNSMIEKKERGSQDNPYYSKLKHEFETQRMQLQEHDECIKKHEESLEDQLARIETMREILDENSNHHGCGSGVKMILEDHEKRLTALEDRMAVYEKQVEKRLAEQHQLLVFTWFGLITTFVLCFAIVCSCCWFR